MTLKRPLEPREIQVAQKLSEGKQAKQIAAEINVGKWTVDRIVADLMEIFEVRSAAGVVGESFRHGVLN